MFPPQMRFNGILGIVVDNLEMVGGVFVSKLDFASFAVNQDVPAPRHNQNGMYLMRPSIIQSSLIPEFFHWQNFHNSIFIVFLFETCLGDVVTFIKELFHSIMLFLSPASSYDHFIHGKVRFPHSVLVLVFSFECSTQCTVGWSSFSGGDAPLHDLLKGYEIFLFLTVVLSIYHVERYKSKK